MPQVKPFAGPRVVMPPEGRSAITGHSAKLDESAGYGDGMGTMLQVMARYLATVKPLQVVVEADASGGRQEA